MERIPRLVFALSVCGLAFAGSALVPRGTPDRSVAQLLAAAQAGSLDGIEAAVVPQTFAELVSSFGQERYRQVRRAFDAAAMAGRAPWSQLRRKADYLGESAFDLLHERVLAGGRAAFARLSVDERLRLMDDTARYREFVYEQGLTMLSPEDRGQTVGASDFLDERGRARFVAREGWKLLPTEERAAVGSADALADTDTVSRRRLTIRLGMPLIDPEVAALADGVQQDELDDQASFVQKHGIPAARAYLGRPWSLSGVPRITCEYPAVRYEGSLLKRDRARCVVMLGGANGSVSLTMRRLGSGWLTEDCEPTLRDVVGLGRS